MYRNGLGDDLSGCCDDCGSLAGMGLTLPPTEGQTGAAVPWWQAAISEITKIIPRTTTVPVYTNPTFPSYPVNATTSGTPASSMFSPETNWLPWVIGGAVLLILTRRR